MTVLVRGVDDRFMFSADASGERLHRRGARVEMGAAPLRETLAAGLLALAGWRPGTALVDPMCGAGTIVIEAAMQALGRAPGRRAPRSRWSAGRAHAMPRSRARSRRCGAEASAGGARRRAATPRTFQSSARTAMRGRSRARVATPSAPASTAHVTLACRDAPTRPARRRPASC